MVRTPRFREKRTRIDVLLNSNVLKACDHIADVCGVTRTDVIETGLCHVFERFIETIENLKGVGTNG